MIHRRFLGFLVVFLLVAPAWSMMHAQAQGGSINVFSNGAAEFEMVVSGGHNNTVGFELQRNTTINSASFFIKPSNAGDSPACLRWTPIKTAPPNGRSTPRATETSASRPSFHRVTAWKHSASIPTKVRLSPPDSPPFFLPTGATISSSGLDVDFSPTLTGGFFQTGYIHAVDKGDLNYDNNTDFAMLANGHHQRKHRIGPFDRRSGVQGRLVRHRFGSHP